jgi:hypothetical protein
MGSKAKSLAIVNEAGEVETFVRLDVPAGWTPPAACTAIPDDELPAGWSMAAAPTAPVPKSISPMQARLWLVRNGIALTDIDAAIESISDQQTRDTVRVQWEYGLEVVRSSDWLAALGPVLGLDDTTLDQAFREAAAL